MKAMNRFGIALALAVTGTAAQALPLTDYDSTVVNVYFGGATATDNVLENVALAVTGGYCVAGTIDVYRASNQRAVFCRVSSATVPGFPVAPGAKVAFHKESQGGSSNGVNPLIDVAFGQAHGLRWLDLDQLRVEAGNSCGAGVAAGGGALKAYTNHTTCNLLQTPVDTAGSAGAAGRYDANGGISDVEPALSFPAPTAAQIARLTSRAGLGIVFGVPVSTNLYRALQIAQGKAQTDNPVDIPSLTSEQIRGIYSSNIVDWTQLTDATTGAALPAVAGVTPPTGGDTTIYICRRVGTSGTQASSELYWLNQRCANGTATFVDPNDGSTVNDTIWVTANPNNGNVNAGPSSGNVRSCMNIYGTTNGLWAIGVLSTEVSAANLTEGNFRMVAVDGAAPTLQNVANGAYDFWTENTLNRVAPNNTGAIPPGDLRLVLLQYIENNMGLPALISQLNSPFQNRPWGDGGVLAIPNGSTILPNGSPATNAEMDTNPVNTATRSPLGPVNNCSPAISTQSSPVLRDTQVLP